MKTSPLINRRGFLTRALAFTTGGVLLAFAKSKDILASTFLSPDDPVAKSLGYSEDAKKVDAKKWPTWKAGRNCLNCNLYQKVSGTSGNCTLFPGKWVKPEGWCSTWIEIVKK